MAEPEREPPQPLPQGAQGGGGGGGGALSWMSELTRALDHGIQSAGTFLETNSALLANTLALDKLNEHDGVESLKVIYSEDPAALHAISEILLLQEQARSMGELAVNYSHALAQVAQSGQMFGESLQKLALKRDPRPETLWETGWHALTLDQLLLRGGNNSNTSGTSRKEPPPEGPLPEGLSTIQQLLYTLAQGQLAAHARLLEQAETSPGHMFKALEALKEQYRQEVKGINEKYMESKRRWRYSLSQAVAHRHLPEEATRFEAEATMWRRQWESTSPELVEAARKVKNDNAPKITKVLAAYVQAQLKTMNKAASALQREEYKLIEIDGPGEARVAN